jgi:hypothetical protein
MDRQIAEDGQISQGMVECLSRICETLRMHDERAAKIEQMEVTIMSNEGALMKLQEDTQRDLQELTNNVKEMTTVISSHEDLIKTNSTLVTELADIVKWLTTEQTKYRQTQSGMLWKVLTAVLGALSTIMAALVIRGY